MRERKPKSIQASSTNNGIKLYVEGKTERSYLGCLMTADVIKSCTIDPKLQGSQVQLIIEQIKRDLDNDAIDMVIWVVDGGDEHICGKNAPKKQKKQLSDFQIFYKKWLDDLQNGKGRKLRVLINQPAIEFWTLLHHTDCATYFASNADLIDSQDLKNAMPNFTKGQSTKYLKDVCSKTCAKRVAAIKRAVTLDKTNQSKTSEEKVELKIPQAQIYQIFEILKP